MLKGQLVSFHISVEILIHLDCFGMSHAFMLELFSFYLTTPCYHAEKKCASTQRQDASDRVGSKHKWHLQDIA